jgi:16S rRNA processing protein RimM
METIPKVDCENIGFIRKTHGIRGELVLEFEPHFEYSVEEAERFFVELEGLLVPFFLKDGGLRFKTGNSAIITFDLVETENYAKRLVGNPVYLYQTEIVDEPEQSLESQFENYLLVDKTIGEIGLISHVDDYAGNIVLTVKYRGEELLIPYNDELLVAMDEMQKTIMLDLPEGLIELS